MSTASESESIRAMTGDTDAMSENSLRDIAGPYSPPLAAAARPESLFAQQLALQNLISDADEEHEPMHKWLDDRNDPWSVPRILNGEERVRHALPLH